MRKKLFLSKAFYLHETGDLNYDQLMVEYNGLLINKKYKQDVWDHVLRKFVENFPNWNELFVSGAEEISEFESIASHYRKMSLNIREEMPIYWADLSLLNDTDDAYLQSLSSNTRYQIRRSMRQYEEKAEIGIQSASTVSQALEYLGQLKELHQKYWIRRGHAGAFANPIFEKFHKELIEECLPKGEVQLLKITWGSDVIGYLYNFVLNDTVYSYQSGLNYSKDKKLKPGLVGHYLAIKYNMKLGRIKYDFLAGESQYKKSLSNNSAKLYWLVLQKTDFMLKLEKNLKIIKAKLIS